MVDCCEYSQMSVAWFSLYSMGQGSTLQPKLKASRDDSASTQVLLLGSTQHSAPGLLSLVEFPWGRCVFVLMVSDDSSAMIDCLEVICSFIDQIKSTKQMRFVEQRGPVPTATFSGKCAPFKNNDFIQTELST